MALLVVAARLVKLHWFRWSFEVCCENWHCTPGMSDYLLSKGVQCADNSAPGRVCVHLLVCDTNTHICTLHQVFFTGVHCIVRVLVNPVVLIDHFVRKVNSFSVCHLNCFHISASVFFFFAFYFVNFFFIFLKMLFKWVSGTSKKSCSVLIYVRLLQSLCEGLCL